MILCNTKKSMPPRNISIFEKQETVVSKVLSHFLVQCQSYSFKFCSICEFLILKQQKICLYLHLLVTKNVRFMTFALLLDVYLSPVKIYVY